MQAKKTQQQGHSSGTDRPNQCSRPDRLGTPVCGLDRRLAAGLAALFFSAWPALEAAEIVPFRTTSVEGKVELRYSFEERIDSNAGVESFNQEQTTYEEEVSVLTRNYVYHPNLLKLDLGAGVTFVQDEFEANDARNEDDDDLYSFLARAMLLSKKAYPMTFYYTRENPVTFPGLAERIQQTNTLYGFDMALLEPLVPLNIKLFASRSDFDGDSPTQIVDETTDKRGLHASKAYSDNYSQNFRYDHTEEDSASGRRDLAINPTTRTTEVFTYDSDWRIRAELPVRYYDRISVTREKGVVDRDELNFTPNLVWAHSDQLQSAYGYSFFDSEVDSSDTTNHRINARLNYNQSERTQYELLGIFQDNTTTGVDNEIRAINGQVSYQKPVTLGTLSLTAGLGYRENDREARAGVVVVIGEPVTLAGLTPVALANEFVVASSVVVQNQARSQTFVEGLDYRLIEIGAVTQIQRLGGSNIGDPEQVVVDYTYATGGDASYTTVDQSYSIGLASKRNYNLYLRYRESEQDLTSGNPTLPLNSEETLSLGGGVEYALSRKIEIGADIDFTEHDEDISPYDSRRLTAYANFLLPRSTNLRVTASQSHTDNERSDEDIDLTTVGIQVRARPRNRLTLSAELYAEEDTGGTLLRKRDNLKLLARWQIYRLTLNAVANIGTERTGDSETDREDFMLTLRRDF